MKNAGLFSTIFLDSVQEDIDCTDEAQGRLVTLSQSWERRDAASAEALWKSFVKAALGNLGFVISELSGVQAGRGLHQLYEDYGFQNCVALLYLVEPDADLDDQSVGRFWPAKLITALREKKLNWGILTNGATWRLYSTKSAKPFEDHVELDLAAALTGQDETAYALFERFFHADCFVPVERDDYEAEKAKQFKALGLKVKRQKRAASGGEDEESEEEESDAEKERKAGIYLSRLDLDGEVSEGVLEAWVKSPLLGQVDGVLRYICNGFIADTPRTGDAYTEDERREVFESSVKLLYRCLFLFYAEARKLLPSEERHADLYAPHSIRALCEEARKFRWNERSDHSGYDLWQHLKGLVQAVNEGDPGYGIMGYNGGLFDDQEERFLGQHRLRNDFIWPALYWLAYVDPIDEGGDEEYAIPYQDLEVRHLGEMYEAILEYKVRLADTDYLRRRTKNGWQTLPAVGQRTQEGDIRIKAGDIFFGETALERKQSGSYYTPESLVRFLVGKAVIAPLQERWDSTCEKRFGEYLEQTRAGFDDAARRGAIRSAEELIHDFVKREVLTYKVCDPAMGSGHFLVAAANLMADFVAGLLARIEPLAGAPSGITGAPNHWRRLVTRHCLYGADLNPLAVNLAKLALWLNCFARDHKLTFLDHHLRCGNSLIGLRDLSALKKIPIRRKDGKRIQEEIEAAENELPLGLGKELAQKLSEAATAIRSILDMAEDDTDRQREAFAEASGELQGAFAHLADLHTAHLMDSSIRPACYARLLAHFAEGGRDCDVPRDLGEVWVHVKTLSTKHDFFHWPLEYPDIFGASGDSGFSATVGNPPWDIVKPKSVEFFPEFDPNFRAYGKQEASRIAKKLMEEEAIERKWSDYEQFYREMSEYFTEPLVVGALGSGDINTYKLFLWQFLQLLKPGGEVGIVTPSGFYSDPGCQPLRELYFETTNVELLYGFENRWPVVFPAVDSRFKFMILNARKGGKTECFHAAFMQHDPAKLVVIDESAILLQMDDIVKVSEGTLALPEVSDPAAMLVARKLQAFPRLGSGWELTVEDEIHKTNDSGLFCEADSDSIPVFEGGQIWHFDSAFAEPEIYMPFRVAEDYSERQLVSASRYRKKLKTSPDPSYVPEKSWWDEPRLAFREVAAATNERTFICSILPPRVMHTYALRTIERFFLVGTTRGSIRIVENWTQAELLTMLAAFNSFTCDYAARLKGTNHLSTAYAEIPMPREILDDTVRWELTLRSLRLVCVAEGYADLWSEVFPQVPSDVLDALASPPPPYGPAHEQSLRARLADSYGELTADWATECGLHDRNSDRRDTGDRAQTRAEIDALVAHLYSLTRDEFAYILDTFPVLRRKEIAAFGEYQSKRKALEEFDRFEKEVKP